MLESIRQMLKAFDENNIIYCHWKSNEHLEEALNGETDLDVLFLPEQRCLLDHVLSGLGLKRFRDVPLMQYNAIEDYIGFDVETAKIWHLHTHYRMTFGEKHLKGYTTNWQNAILERRMRDKTGIFCSSIEDEYFLLLIRIAMKRRKRDFGKKLGSDDTIELVWLRERANREKVFDVAKQFLGAACAAEIDKLLQVDLHKKSQFSTLHKKGKKALKPYKGYSSWGSTYMRTRREIFWLVGGLKRRLGVSINSPSRRVSPSGGAVVAFLGCDGAGKSTTLAYVKKEFKKKLDVKAEYLGSGDGSSSLLRKPMKLIAKKVGGKGVGHSVDKELDSNKESKKKISLKVRLYSFAKVVWAVTLAKEKKTKLHKISKARNSGMLVLIDRYPQTEIAGYSDGPLLSRYIENKGLYGIAARYEQRIYESAYTNAPDLFLKLMVPTEVAIARKPEMTVDEIDNKKVAVRAMYSNCHCVEIDTSRDKSITFGEAMDAIWQVI
ncbi:hypothetical protein [Holdemania massiliensis]|uniref:hypothetical protein n=1 Tax=Holdemania massiliensis TaxID=1468449 RepID=UPI001F06B9C4|nr:hypothetical protein [Holdemania massiliensis]MCH1940701.1 hypothetical protein [Holdemania massiliensis]